MGPWAVLGLGVAVALGAGCNCGSPPPESDLTVEFLKPAEGQVLTFADDADPSAPGLQYAVEAQAIDSSGRTVELESATLESRPSTVEAWSAAPAGTVSAASATFPPITVASGTSVLRASVVEQGSGRVATRIITIEARTGRPTVDSVTFVGDADNNYKLNATELPSGTPVADIATSGLEDGRPIRVKDASSGVVYGETTASKGHGRVTLSGLPLTATTEASFPLVVEVSALGGRTNNISVGTPSDPLNSAAFVPLKVDRVPPVLSVISPATPALTLTDDADPTTAGYQLRLTVQTSADVRANGVRVHREPPGDDLDLTPNATDQRVTLDTTITGSELVSYTFTVAAKDDAGNANSATVHVDVKTARPAVASVAWEGDANADGQLNVSELASGKPVAIIGTTHMEDGQAVVVKDAASGTVYGTGTTTGNSARVTLTSLPVTDISEASFDLIVELKDKLGVKNQLAAGVPGDPQNTAAFRALRVDRVPPSYSVLAPVSLTANLAEDADKTPGNGYQLRLVVQISADVSSSVVVDRSPLGDTVNVTPGTDHRITVDTTTQQDEPIYGFLITATDAAGNVSTRSFDVFLGFQLNGVNIVDGLSNTVPFTSGPLTFVAKSNEHFFPTATPGYVADATPGAPANVSLLSFQLVGGMGSKVTLQYNGTPVATPVNNVTADPAIVTFSDTALPQSTSGTLTLRVALPDGSETSYSTQVAAVDVVPPSQTAGALALVTTSPFSERRPALDVSWTATGDDGTTGAPVGHDVRWSTDAIFWPNTPAGRTGIDADDRFFDALRTKAVGVLPASATTTRITGLPTVGTYYVQVRAKDEVGNLAPLVAQSCGTRAGCVDHPLNVLTINNPGSVGGLFGFLMRSNGDLNGDGTDDLVMGVQNGPRDVWISYGSASLTGMATPLQVPIPPTAVATGIYDFAIGNAGELAVATTRIQDVILADPTWRSNRGRYLLYFGKTGGTTIDTTPVELRGTAAGSNTSVSAGSANDIGYVRIVPDFGSSGGGPPDGFDEVFISANAESGGNGVAYLFYGRSIEGWRALQSATDATDPGISYVPMTSADRVFSGEAPPPCGGCTPTPTPAGSLFSVRRAYVGLGDINADGVPDFTVPAARDFVNKLYVFSGAAIASSPTAVPASSALQILQQTAPASPPPVGAINGFASDAVGNARFFGGKDLAVGYPAVDQVMLYRQQGTGFPAAPAITITGGGRFGNTLAVGDVNADGRPDLIVGTNNNVSGGGILTGGWIMYNTGVLGAEFDTRWAEGFNQSRVLKDPNDASTPNAMGISVAAGDFNKDGLIDVAVADHRSGTGKVYIRY